MLPKRPLNCHISPLTIFRICLVACSHLTPLQASVTAPLRLPKSPAFVVSSFLFSSKDLHCCIHLGSFSHRLQFLLLAYLLWFIKQEGGPLLFCPVTSSGSLEELLNQRSFGLLKPRSQPGYWCNSLADMMLAWYMHSITTSAERMDCGMI